MAAVLVVEDDSDTAEVVSRYLEKGGHAVQCAPNGRDALGALSSRKPDVVVLDVHMPEMDGAAFLEVIRCYLRWSSLPVILLTAMPLDGPDVARARESGVKRVFFKAQYDLADLLECVNEYTRPKPRPPSLD